MGITITNSGQGSVVRFRNLGRGGVMTSTKNPSVDVDAQAFFNRVTTAGGTLSATEQTAVNTLVVSMKAAGIWTSMKAIYPMVGASAASCAQNLKSSSFTGTFTSGWTFASTGVTPNGTSAYMNPFLNPSLDLTNNNYSLTHYSRTQKITGTEVDMGGLGTPFNMIALDQYYQGAGKAFVAGYFVNDLIVEPSATNTLGFQVNTRTSQTSAKMFFNNVQIGATLTLVNSRGLPGNIIIGANINNTTPQEFSSKECAFASLGDGLTDTQSSNFYTAVQAFQTTLSRQV
jgi:hypothetical protein